MRFEVSKVLDAIEARLTTDPALARAVVDLSEVVRYADLDGGRPASMLRLGLVIDALGRHVSEENVPVYAVAPRALLSDLDRAEVGSLNATVAADDESAAERMDVIPSTDRDTDPEYAAMREGAVARFRAAFDQLPERERKVALLLHVNNLTLREVGEVLGVSESRVCQIHGRLKRGLRELLSADELLFLEVA